MCVQQALQREKKPSLVHCWVSVLGVTRPHGWFVCVTVCVCALASICAVLQEEKKKKKKATTKKQMAFRMASPSVRILCKVCMQRVCSPLGDKTKTLHTGLCMKSFRWKNKRHGHCHCHTHAHTHACTHTHTHTDVRAHTHTHTMLMCDRVHEKAPTADCVLWTWRDIDRLKQHHGSSAAEFQPAVHLWSTVHQGRLGEWRGGRVGWGERGQGSW